NRSDAGKARLAIFTPASHEGAIAMTTLHQYKAKQAAKFDVAVEPEGAERREHRRHDLEQQGITIDRWDGARRGGEMFGKIVDLSAGGVRIRTDSATVRADQQVRVRIELPVYAGICPFIDASQKQLQP